MSPLAQCMELEHLLAVEGLGWGSCACSVGRPSDVCPGSVLALSSVCSSPPARVMSKVLPRTPCPCAQPGFMVRLCHRVTAFGNLLPERARAESHR